MDTSRSIRGFSQQGFKDIAFHDIENIMDIILELAISKLHFGSSLRKLSSDERGKEINHVHTS